MPNRILAAAREYLAPENFTVEPDDYRWLADELDAFNPGSDADSEFQERMFDLRGMSTSPQFEAERNLASRVLRRLAEWNPEPAEKRHSPVHWFTPDMWPSCLCGYAPRDNGALNAHWAEHGIRWMDTGGRLVARRTPRTVPCEECNGTGERIYNADPERDSFDGPVTIDCETCAGMGKVAS